jgi:hypothetical protein
MAICPNCGVELGDEASACPLCRAVLPRGGGDRPARDATYPDMALDEDFQGLSPRDRKKIFLEVFSICSMIAVFVLLAVNLLLDRAISWSSYPLASIALAWLGVCIPLILEKRPWLVFAVLGPALLGFVLLLDVLDGNGLSWFLLAGGPITLLTEGVVVGLTAIVAASKRKGLNVFALLLLGVAVLCLGIEAAINLNIFKRFQISWSAVVATAAVPVAGFLFYLHYRIVNRASLRKLFHV